MSDLKIRQGVSTHRDAREAAAELHRAIAQPDATFALFYASPAYDPAALGEALAARFTGMPLIGCTTAGEITPEGYLHGSLTGLSIASPDFRVVTERIDPLKDFAFAKGGEAASRAIARLRGAGPAPTARDTFGFLLVDGLSNQEEAVVSALSGSLGDISLFGGSAGDGTRFERTLVYHDGAFHADAAVFSLVRTTRPFVVFKTQHFVASERRMVVTEADTRRRVVTEINGEPAGREYARMVGLPLEQLTPLVFSEYPVVVRVGGAYYVRSIQKVNPDESLTFFCAIDEGIVLTVARGVDLVDNLRSAFDGVRSSIGEPELILGCDCILRNLELDRRGLKQAASQVLKDNRVFGFSTYGEQLNAMHVNQTFTAVAIGAGAS